MGSMTTLRKISRSFLFLTGLLASTPACASDIKASVSEAPVLPVMRPEFPVPNEPNMLFYVQRSVNANTVVYTAHLDGQGLPAAENPIDVYWRWYNVDGHRKPLNFIEREMAYGVTVDDATHASGSRGFEVAALPKRKLILGQDSKGKPEALIQMGSRLAKLVYVYLNVDDSGLMPSVKSIDLFGVDTLTGKI